MSTQISPLEFVQAWQASNTPEEVAAKLGMAMDMVKQRARTYRAKGVPLKVIEKPYIRVDWTELAQTAKDLTPKA